MMTDVIESVPVCPKCGELMTCFPGGYDDYTEEQEEETWVCTRCE